jgi:hypothetical protein
MPNNRITFHGVTLLSFSRGHQGGRAKFAAQFTDTVRRGMGWGPIPESAKGADLEGELVCESVDIIPKHDDLAKCAISFRACRLNLFHVVRLRLPRGNGKGYRFELRFTLAFADLGGAASLESYLLTVGDVRGNMSVSFHSQAKQQNLLVEEKAS